MVVLNKIYTRTGDQGETALGDGSRVAKHAPRVTAYGTGLFSPSMDLATFGSRFHGNDERVDVDSLGLSANFFHGIARDLVG